MLAKPFGNDHCGLVSFEAYPRDTSLPSGMLSDYRFLVVTGDEVNLAQSFANVGYGSIPSARIASCLLEALLDSDDESVTSKGNVVEKLGYSIY